MLLNTRPGAESYFLNQPSNYQETVEIVFEEADRDEPVNAFELGCFLYYYRAAYVGCLASLEFKETPLDEAIALAKRNLLAPLSREVAKLWHTELTPDLDLEFFSISNKSPLKFGVKAAGVSRIALTMAAIFSGGEANVYSGQFKLPPIAHGIHQLKEAFRQEQTRQLPSERHSSSRDPSP